MLVGIDIGSHKICTLIGTGLPGGGLRVLGIGHAPASGIRRGEVIDVEEAAGAIAASVVRAERVAEHPVDRAVVGITGLHLESANHSAMVACGRRPREIRPPDVDRALAAAGSLPLPMGRELVHVLPQSYTLDDGSPVISPVGMEGYQLSAEVHIVSGSCANLSNLRRCLDLAEVAPQRLTMSTLAAAEAVLTPDERELGVAVVDVGASATGIACFREGALVHTRIMPVGGRHMTNDLAVVFQTPLHQAERIKTTHGHVLPELDDDSGVKIEVVPFGDGERRTATRREISEVLAARADELIDLVLGALSEAELASRLPAGAVLVGGGTELAGFPRRFSQRSHAPVRIGRPGGVIGLSEATKGPDHAAAVGLLMWSARRIRDAATGLANGEEETNDGKLRWSTWLRDAFLPRRNGRQN